MTTDHPAEPAARPVALDPSIAPIFDLIPDFTADAETVATLRELFGSVAAEGSDQLAREHTVDAERGVIVRVLGADSPGATPRPALFWMHGGGYVIGNRSMDDIRTLAWATSLGCVVASVEYRLAPEHPYPAPLEDCYDGLRWVHAHADELGIDPGRIGIGGISAGGGLAAALALLARDRGELPVAFQLLDSPMIDDRQITPSSRGDWLTVWNRESNEFGWRSYLGDLYGTHAVPAHAAAARADQLVDLPPTLVVVGSADGFRDEDIWYATRLLQAGVPTELHVYPGAPHGFTMFDVPLARRADADIGRWLADRFAAAP